MTFFRRRTDRNDRTAPAPAPGAEELATLAAVRAQGGVVLFGAPTRCPHCGGYGLVEGVDEERGRCDNRCPGCRQRWTITTAALAAHPAAARSAAATAPVGDGILVRHLVAA